VSDGITLSEGVQMNILIVDDHPGLLDGMRRLLESSGHNAYTARCSVEAKEIFQREKIDLTITDYNMEPLLGIELAQQLKQVDEQACIWLYSSDEELIEYFGSNLSHYGLAKAVDKKYISHELKRAGILT
jgi:DNA-binding response OmpR family regulator